MNAKPRLVHATSVGRDSRPHISAFLRHRTGNGRSLHFALVVYDHAGVVLKVDCRSVLAMEGLTLTNDYARHDLLPELRLTLLDGGHDHVSDGGARHSETWSWPPSRRVSR